MKLKYKILALSAATILSTGCTDNFEDINTNPNTVLPEDVQAGFYFDPLFTSIYKFDPAWQNQLQQNLNADLYSGYMTNPRPFIAGANNGTYALVDGWNNFIFSIAYPGVMQNAQYIIDSSKESNPNFYALALILRVEGMHRLADTFGPIVYTKFKESLSEPEYDSLENTYKQFFTDLDEAIAILDQDLSNIGFAEYDKVYSGDLTKWVKFANTLRLRLAMRVSNVDASLSKTEAEKSLNHSVGLLENVSDNFYIETGLTNPLVTFSSSWDDTRMNASIESIMGGYEDPRLEPYFQVSGVVSGEYKGIRNGLPLLPQYSDELEQKAAYVSFSKLGANYDNALTPITGVQLMTAAEAFFLKAEAALKGYSNAGDAKSNYEMGVMASFNQYGLDIADYLTSSNLPKDYVDPVDASNSIGAMSTVSPNFDEATSDEEKLEKIITQKWIAMFPDGQEAWSEYRRTGYPKIFPVVSNQSNGTIDTDEQIKRINFPLSERQSNPNQVEKAVGLLGGPDTGGTALWWDVN